jgi:hypothetical protein
MMNGDYTASPLPYEGKFPRFPSAEIPESIQKISFVNVCTAFLQVSNPFQFGRILAYIIEKVKDGREWAIMRIMSRLTVLLKSPKSG